MNKKIALFGAGERGIDICLALGKEHVDCFIDNDLKKVGTTIEGIPVKALTQCLNENYEIWITVSKQYEGQILDQLEKNKCKNLRTADSYMTEIMCNSRRIKEYKNKYAGKRCFVIGSGPSLTLHDLQMLYDRNEICFGANKIFKLFSNTKWRPSLYCATDRRILSFYEDQINKLRLDNMFIAYYENKNLYSAMKKYRESGKILFHIKESENQGEIDFSLEPENYIVEGKTVIYAMIQFAVYMGFKEICLLGVDFSYSDSSGMDSNGNDHFCKNYVEKGETVLFSPLDYCKRAFEEAEKVSIENGVKIYNATRGGKLEVFERKTLEEILNE